ncbi:hypothetical protein OHS70_38125 [Streptomyces sp. NBC_00390]
MATGAVMSGAGSEPLIALAGGEQALGRGAVAAPLALDRLGCRIVQPVGA